MALVLMVMPSHRLPVGKAQPPLGPLEGLDGRFLVHTDYHGILWRVQIQAHDVGCFLGKLRIGTDTPTAPPLQVNTVPAQDPPHVQCRNVSQCLGHQPTRPHRAPLRRRLVQLGQYSPLGDLVVLGRLARPGRVAQSRYAVSGKSGTPPAHGSRTHLQQGGDLLRRLSRRGLQNYAGSLHHALLRGGPAYPGRKGLPFVIGQLDGCRYSHDGSLSSNAIY